MRALLVTIGSLGDLHPFIAIGRALEAEGAEVTLAVPHDHREKVETAGLAARAILPSFAALCAGLGLTEAEAAARVVSDPDFVIEQVLLPALRESSAALDALADGADVVVSSIFALAGGLVAEKRGLPLVEIVLQPMSLFSAWQPPRAPRFEAMRHAPNGPLGRGWNRLLYRAARRVLRRRYAALIDSVRRDHGLAPSSGAPLMDPPATRVRGLCCYSPVLGALHPDAPPNTDVVGFPVFDSQSGAEEALDPRLAAFLDRGEAPIIFSLGSVAWAASGGFYREAAQAARRVGRRAVLLTGEGEFHDEGDHASIAYAPHSQLFDRCAAIVHHGGIGSTGQALRAGRPQLVVPFFGDQHDNAERVRRLGVGRDLPAARFTADRAAVLLAAMLKDRPMAVRAEQVARQVRAEDGAREAARRIMLESEQARYALSETDRA